MLINLIPTDFKNYLESHNQRTFKTKEAGPFEIIGLKDLELHLVPTDIDNAEFFNNDDVSYGKQEDPHYQEMGCYLVKCINLIKHSELYNPFGQLIWLPEYKCYGIWDNSHIIIYKFKSHVTWSDIISDLESYIDSGWDYQSTIKEILIPWPKNEYSKEQIYEHRKINL